jgi:hypothetical protein
VRDVRKEVEMIKVEHFVRLDDWLDIVEKTDDQGEYLSFSGHSLEEAHSL